jgi:hypothetical protein
MDYHPLVFHYLNTFRIELYRVHSVLLKLFISYRYLSISHFYLLLN